MAIRGVQIDSRLDVTDKLFVAIRTATGDGNQYVGDAFRRGAAAALSQQSTWEWPFARQVIVEDSVEALGRLGEFLRRRSTHTQVIGITGSNGKTTTKEMAASVLQQRFRVLKGMGNQNNHIGVPLNLLHLQAGHEVAVLEFGMSARGEIRQLCEIADPEIGVLTNISAVHLQFLKSTDEVARAKGELLDYLGERGWLIYNADDEAVCTLAAGFGGRRIAFGIEAEAAVRATSIHGKGRNGMAVTLEVKGKQLEVHLPLIGRHNLYNALAAAAVGVVLGLSLREIRTGLRAMAAVPMRMEISCYRGCLLINDAYNANPRSMEVAIDTLGTLGAGAGCSYLVLGDMLELGEQQEEYHRCIGAKVAAVSVDALITVGDLAKVVAEEACRCGMSPDRVWSFGSHEEAGRFLAGQLQRGDRVLVKGSRGSGMERVLTILKARKA